MKTLRSKEAQAKVEELAQAREEMKALQEKAEKIRDYFFAILGDAEAAKVGAYVVLVNQRTRTSLDQKALEAYLGEEFEQFKRETAYKTIELKEVK